MTRHTLKSKLLRIILTTMLAVGGAAFSVMGWTSYAMERDRLAEIERQIRETISSEADMLAATHALALKGLVADNAFSDVGELVTGAVRNDADVVYGLFIGSDGKPWALVAPGHPNAELEDGISDADLAPLQIDAHTFSGLRPSKRVVHAYGEDVQEHSAPVLSEEGDSLGTIVYGFSDQRTRRAVAAVAERSRQAFTRAFIASCAAALISLIIGIAWVLSSATRITRPVGALTTAAHQISQGKRGVRVSISSGDEIEVLAAAFNRMLEANEESMRKLELTTEQALAADRMKSEFLANTSHEIRTPMNGVLGMIQLIQAMPLDGKLRRYVDTIEASANALLTIINDILDFSKMEAGKLAIHEVPFDASTIVQEVAELLAGRAHDKKIELICRTSPELPAVVLGDQDRFRQVLNNLVGNSVKFTERGEVFIDLQVASKDEKNVVVEVAVHDTGIGIDSKDLPKLYEAFSQVDGTRVRRYGGTGLGLAICKRLVQMMGGEIRVESQPGKGSVFTFTARFGIEKRQDSGRPLPAAGPARRILVLEQSKRWRDVIGEQLAAWNMQVETYERGAAALQRLRSEAEQGRPFDAALLGTNIDGFTIAELIHAIRAEGVLKTVPLVVLSVPSARGLPEIQGDAIFEVNKPIRFYELYRLLSGRERSDGSYRPAPPESGPTALVSRRPILVVDDNDINRFVAVEELVQRGYRTDEAANGLEAYEKFKAAEYLCVLMDCQMPVMDGCDGARAIRRFEAEKGRSRTPIIALTAHALVGERERVIDAGMDDFLSKPFRSSSLDRILKLHIPGESAAALPTDLEPEVKRSEKLIRLFLERLPGQLDDLQKAIESDARDQARALAHKIKGSCLALAATRMSKTAETIQRHSAAGELVVAAARLAELRGEFETVAALLQKELSGRNIMVSENPVPRT